MVRSMFSGVSGLRAHQTRMDTIGNNIANVNTYGFKSGRTTFRDIYYQTMSSAAAPTAAAGGMNPSQVGYGSKVGNVDLMMGRSTFSMTDQTMDLAIDGEGFFQVQDGAGNIYYTRAGMLNFDASGNLVDMQGNYVLGINGDPQGRMPASERIRVTLPAVPPTAASVEQQVNGRTITIKATNPTSDGNLNFNFTTDSSIADGTMEAVISATGVIIKMNPTNTYATLGAFQNAVNDAIIKANGNKELAAGRFNISIGGANPFAGGGLTAEEICSTNYGVISGTASFGGKDFFGGVSPTGKVGNGFSGNGAASAFTATFDLANEEWDFSMTIGGTNYTASVGKNRTDAGKFILYKNGDDTSDDYIELNRPSYNDLIEAWQNSMGVTTQPTNGAQFDVADRPTAAELADFAFTPSTPSKALGLSGTAFALRGGTGGGAQTIADMTGISIAPNGVITGWDSQGKEIIIGRIDIATFANPAGLNQAGSSNYTETANSGTPKLSQPGSSGSGKLVGGTLELSNVDLSREFSDMITTQRGYQANSRIITVSDTMLEELINLKR